MNEPIAPDGYGILTEPATLKIQRLLPGSIERVWAYLTETELRCQWLAAGQMDLTIGAPFELTWRNDELSDTPGQRPEGFSEEHHMHSQITEIAPPHKIAFTWQGSGEVCIELESQGDKVMLTLTHRRLPNRNTTLVVSAGWHTHLDLLQAKLSGNKKPPFWAAWLRLKDAYDQRLG